MNVVSRAARTPSLAIASAALLMGSLASPQAAAAYSASSNWTATGTSVFTVTPGKVTLKPPANPSGIWGYWITDGADESFYCGGGDAKCGKSRTVKLPPGRYTLFLDLDLGGVTVDVDTFTIPGRDSTPDPTPATAQSVTLKILKSPTSKSAGKASIDIQVEEDVPAVKGSLVLSKGRMRRTVLFVADAPVTRIAVPELPSGRWSAVAKVKANVFIKSARSKSQHLTVG